MLQKNVMGIGELLLRVTAVSRLVAIIPQKEEGFEEEDLYSQFAPPGFLLIPLAFEDDIRVLPRKHDFTPEKCMVDAAVDLIRHQNIEESIEIGQSFENPVLKTFWNYIESVALGTPLEEGPTEDNDTKMNVEGILAFAGDKIETFRDMIPEDVVEKKLQRKRKPVESIPDDTGIDWDCEYEMDTFNELKVDELKAYLRSHGEKVGGRKGELIERIRCHIKVHLENRE